MKQDIPDEEVKVKMSICNECGGVVRSAVEHMMDLKMRNEFAREVFKHNLNVKLTTLLEYRNAKQKWCDC